MKNKGFTLVELLGVIIILSLLMLIVLPKITNSTRNSSIKVDKVTEDLIFKATNLYLNDKEDEYTKGDGVVYCISLNDLVDNDYLKSPIKTSNNDDITNVKVVEANYQNGYSYKLKDNGTCIQRIPPNKPDLFNGDLTPIKYNGTNWVVVDGSKTNWYNYENQEWANAVILNNEVTKNIGDTVDVNSEVKAMFVWIPRYEYKIDGTYGKGGTSAESPGEIEVNFVLNTKSRSSEGYRIHPAFKFGSKELTGIWVGKFETSHETLSSSTTSNNLGCSDENCTNADGLRILPNVASLRYNNVSNFFYASRSMTRIGNGFGLSLYKEDSHMMKNSEWGAVAYLSQSKYGKYGNSNYEGVDKEVKINNCSNYITGIGADNQNDSSSANTCTTNTYETQKGQTASTTGNITGIYDMSGGTYEYVMAYLNGTSGTWGATSSNNYSGFTASPGTKYFDGYTDINLIVACNEVTCYGHALSETSGWHGDYEDFVNSDAPWLKRGGYYDNTTRSGVFANFNDSGYSYSYNSFRVVLTAE